MNPGDIAKLRTLTDFPALVAYLRDELDWPIEVEDADDITVDNWRVSPWGGLLKGNVMPTLKEELDALSK